MKKTLFLFALGAFVATPATAVQKCVALTGDTTCTKPVSIQSYTSEWSLSCGDISVKGVAVCGKEPAGTTAQTAEKVAYADGSNTTCFCRVISPVVGSWVWLDNYDTESGCSDVCSAVCTSAFNSWKRTALLFNMTD